MDDGALLTLSQWLSPAFPVSGYAYSHGLEAAISSGRVKSAKEARAWIETVIVDGSGRVDAVLLIHAMSSDADHETLNATAAAYAASRERWEETDAQGRAFTNTVNALQRRDDAPLALPVAVGRAAASLNAVPSQVAALYLQAFAGNLVSCAVRFIPLGQTEGQAVLQDLRPRILETARSAAQTSLEAVTTTMPGADIDAMEHETLDVRIYRS